MRKKLLILLFALSTFSLCACGKTPDTDVDKEPATVTEAPEEKEEQNDDKEEDAPDEDKEPEETTQPTEAPVVEEKKYGEDDLTQLFADALVRPENRMFAFEGKYTEKEVDANGNPKEDVTFLFSGENAYLHAYTKYETITEIYQEDDGGVADTLKKGHEVYAHDFDITWEDIENDEAKIWEIEYDKAYLTSYFPENGSTRTVPWSEWPVQWPGYYPYWYKDCQRWWIDGAKVKYIDNDVVIIAEVGGLGLKELFAVHQFPTAQFLTIPLSGEDAKLVITFTKDAVVKSIQLTPSTWTDSDGALSTYEFNMTFTPITEPQFTPPAELLAVMGE